MGGGAIGLAAAAETRIGDAEAAARLLGPHLAGLADEALGIAYLDDALSLIAIEIHHGQPGSIALPLRAIIGDALRLGARAMVLAHNHPGGDPTPRRADQQATRRITAIAHPLEIRLIDHLVFAAGSWVSFAEMGLL